MMPQPVTLAVALLLAVALPGRAAIRGAEAPYTAVFADGTRVDGNAVQAWHEAGARPKLGDRELFDPNNPVRWLKLDTPPAAPPAAYVEFFGGDRLPGKVLEYRPGNESPYERLAPHLVVEPDIPLHWAPPGQRRPVDVAASLVRRVVWEARAAPRYRPGTVFFRDGRQLAYRALRWGPTSVRLLVDEGTAEAAFAQIAELHLPAQDAWEVYYQQLGLLSPEGSSRLVRVETSDGLRLTASLDRFQARNRGGPPEHWYHGFQPAWSREPLWLRHPTIRLRVYWEPHELPLSYLEPVRAAQRSAVAGGWTWQADRNVQGGPLASGGEEYGWGFGVQAHCELEFELPAIARSFQTRLGLDELAGRGGCARAAVYLDAAEGEPLFQSPLLIGSAEVFDTGRLELPGSSNSRRLVLLSEMAHDNRPRGSDPFDIRDSVDWIEPLVELERQAVRDEVGRRVAAQIPAWQGWKLEEAESRPAALVNYWDLSDQQSPRVRALVAPRQRLLRLSRRIEVEAERPNLLLVASRFPRDTESARLLVEVAGKTFGPFEVPERHGAADPDPILVPLADYAGREVAVAITQLPTGPRGLVDWRGIALISGWPGLRRVFEDEPETAVQLAPAGDSVRLDEEAAYSGSAALRVSAAQGSDPHRLTLDVPIRAQPRLGEFRYLRFAWKKPGQGQLCLSLGHHDGWGPEPQNNDPRRSFRYFAGPGEASYGAGVRLSEKTPAEWTVVTRDLYADFGEFTLTGLSLSVPAGDAAQFDHIYLGRLPADFERIEVKSANP